MNDIEPSSDALFDQAYLVERGVRPMALVGHCTPQESLRILTLLRSAGISHLVAIQALPFVIERNDGHCDYGYASHTWVIDLYRWLARAPESIVPRTQFHRILGLLLGYSAGAIRSHEERVAATTVSMMAGEIPIDSSAGQS